MKEVKQLPRAKKRKLSQQEILEQAALLVAGTINPEAMGVTPDEVDLEQFVQLFMKKAQEMLDKKGERMLLAIGPYLNREGTLFTEDLKPIIDYIEEVTKTEFCFYNGIMVYFGKEDIGASWMPDQPL
jgi:hypothetical protein